MKKASKGFIDDEFQITLASNIPTLHTNTKLGKLECHRLFCCLVIPSIHGPRKRLPGIVPGRL
jgi:hypothetical protein